MNIEFYLPLPPDGFWSALIIYYMVGLFVFQFYMWRHVMRSGLQFAAKKLKLIKARTAYWLVIGAMIWPLMIFTQRNRQPRPRQTRAH